MSLILCLEDSAGQDTELEVNEGDDFATFLQKAKDILGYDVDITSITGDKEVNLTDNIYQFLVTNEVEGEEKEEEDEESIIVKEDVLPTQKQNALSNRGPEENVDEAGTDFDTLEEKLKQLENDVNSSNFETEDNTVEKGIVIKPAEISQDDLDEVEDVEYLMEDAEEEELLNTMEETQPKEEAEEFAEIEYLDDIDNDGQGEEEEMEVEMLDSEFEDDIMHGLGLEDMMEEQRLASEQKRKEKKVSFSELVGLNTELGADKALLKSLNDEELAAPNSEGKQYTRKQLLDILEDSPHEDSDDDIDLTTKAKISSRSKRKLDSYDKKMMKDLFYSTPVEIPKKKRRVSFEFDSKKTRETPKYSFEEMEFLKSTVRQPIIQVINMSLSDINLCLGSIDEINQFMKRDRELLKSTKSSKSSPAADDWKYLPSKYEDVDNDGIYDYHENDPNDDGLLTVISEKPQSKKILKQNKEDVASAVGGIQRLFGNNTPIPKKRGRPRKYENVSTVPKPKPARRDSAEFELFDDIKKDRSMDSDDEYVPGSHFDWTKNRHKGKTVGFYCRMCGAFMAKLGQVNSHALSHRVPGKAVFPCILCPYGYTTYSELCKHIREEHDPKKMVMAKKQTGNQTKSISGFTQTIKKGRGRPPKKLSDEKQREQDDALIGRIISNYSEVMPKYNKTNSLSKKYQRNSGLSRSIQPRFKMQADFASNDDSEDVEDVDMLEEWLDDEEELYIMEMTQNAIAAGHVKIEAENSSDRSRADMSLEADEVHRALTGSRGEDNVFKVEDVHLDSSADIVQRIRTELLADRDDFEIKQLNVSKVVGEDHEKSIESDRIAFISSIKNVTDKIKTENSNKHNNGNIEMLFDQTVIKIEPLKISSDFVPNMKEVKEEFTIQRIDSVVKPGKSIMDIACEGISELIDPTFSTENVVHMSTLNVDIGGSKLATVENVDYNLEDAIMESKQYDPSILSIEEDPQEFNLDENIDNLNTVTDVDSFVNKKYADLNADIEVGEIRDEESTQQNDASDNLVAELGNDQAIAQTVDHSIINDMPKLDDILDYQVEPGKLPETGSNDYKIDSDTYDNSQHELVGNAGQEKSFSMFEESDKIESGVDLFDDQISKSLPKLDEEFTESDKQTPEEIFKLDEEPSFADKSENLIGPESDQLKTSENNADDNQKANFIHEFNKSVSVDNERICQESIDLSSLDKDEIIDEALSVTMHSEDPEDQEMPEDVERMSTKGESILYTDEENDKMEYNDFSKDSKELRDLQDEKLSENVCFDENLSKLDSAPSLHIDVEDSKEDEEIVNPQSELSKEAEEVFHEVEDTMSKLHGNIITSDDSNTKMQDPGPSITTEDGVYEESEGGFVDSKAVEVSKLGTGEISHTSEDIGLSISSDDSEAIMINYDQSPKTEDCSDGTADRDSEKLKESALKHDGDDISSDDDVVTMDYDDFSNEPILQSSERYKTENLASKKISKEHKSHFSEFSPKVSRDTGDSDVSIGLEFDYSKQQPNIKNLEESSTEPDCRRLISIDEDRLDYDDFPSAPNDSSDSKKKIPEESLVPKLDDSMVLIEDSDDVIDFNISRDESNLKDRNV